MEWIRIYTGFWVRVNYKGDPKNLKLIADTTDTKFLQVPKGSTDKEVETMIKILSSDY